MRYDWSEEKIREAVKVSQNKCDVLRHLNIPIAGNNISTLKRKIEKYGIDISHFTGKKSIRNDAAYVPYSEYENGGKKIKTFALKKKLFKEGLKEQKCEMCGLTEWMGKPIVLQLHHKDGNNQNNSLDNLMILCPNCHSQTENYCGKSKEKEEKHCPICGRIITERGNYCPSCAAANRRKINITKERLEKDLKELGTKVAVANKYGVSEAAIRKKMKKLGIS